MYRAVWAVSVTDRLGQLLARRRSAILGLINCRTGHHTHCSLMLLYTTLCVPMQLAAAPVKLKVATRARASMSMTKTWLLPFTFVA